jgi:uncharacterized RDD family membrane protein YckC
MPAGWYRDPSPENLDGHGQRYWDGGAWTPHVHHPSALPTFPTAAPAQNAYGLNVYASASPTTPDGALLAGWWMRVLAFIIDDILGGLLGAAAISPIIISQWDEIHAWFHRIADAERAGSFDSSTFSNMPDIFNPLTGPGFAVVAVTFAVNVLYAIVFLRWKQATPGKLIVGLRVRLRESPDLPWSAILARVGSRNGVSVLTRLPVVGILLSLTLLLDDLWPLWDAKKQALHDKVAGTNVVRIR